MTAPKIVDSIPDDAPRWLHVGGFDVQIPQDVDPMTLDRFAVSVEISVTSVKPDFKIKNKTTEDGGRTIYRTAPRWLYLGDTVLGSERVDNYRPAPEQLMLLTEQPDQEEGVA